MSLSILAGLALIVSVIAQSSPVAFTSVPAVVVAGSSYNIAWGGGDGTPVTLTLREGDPSNLNTIGVIAERVAGFSYSWTVSNSLRSASDYALQITQGQSGINYSSQFSVQSNNTSPNPTTRGSASSVPSGIAGNSTGIGGANATTTRSATLHTTHTVTFTLITNSTALSTTTLPTTSTHLPLNASASATATKSITKAPKSNAAMHHSSSAALVLGMIGAVLFWN